METKTNKVIYPFKIKSAVPLDFELLKREFPENKVYDNILEIQDRDYYASLSFLEEVDGIMFFSLSKYAKYNITVADLKARKDTANYLKANQKVKGYALIAIVKKYNMLLTLYNYHIFNYSTYALSKYLNEKLSMEPEFEIITRDLSEKEIERYSQQVKHIHIKKAQKNYISYEKKVKDSPRKKLKKYTRSKWDVIRFERMGSVPSSVIKGILNKYRKRKYDSIIIDSMNLGQIDILEPVKMQFKCKISTDEDNNSDIEEFKDAVRQIVKENPEFFESYQSS